LQGFEFSLQERSNTRASKKKLCCNFSRSFFVHILLLVLLLVLPPDLCNAKQASERASENWRSRKAAEQQQWT
jgi:hypothetical protein